MRLDRRTLLTGLAATPLGGCGGLPRMAMPSLPFMGTEPVEQKPWGTLPDGQTVTMFTLTNAKGSQARVMTWGGILQSLKVPDRDGHMAEVVLGLDALADYIERSRNFGSTVGRYAGRIEGGRFELDGREVQLDVGSGPHSTHGGPVGFAKRNWLGRPDLTDEGPGVVLTLVSADGDQGFPGQLTISVTYRLTHDDRLILDYLALTDRATVLNPTNHSYFNLSGDPERLILDHDLQIEADAFAAYAPDKIVTGALTPVAGTPFDFRTAKPIGRDLFEANEQLRIGGGYDHSFAVRGQGLRRAGRLSDGFSGRSLEVWTTEPALHVYTANPVEMIGRGGVPYHPHCGVALETQHYQNSPNRPQFPTTILRPGETFTSRTEFRFSAS
ncbi:aldose epimerase family protein [Brevundimonas staleyi]|uniref:Aldose 1-epimerase n=1 Tax=Brevundimonas staleyi TaxID=74326 RepID=A0ABW0FQU6_9CAUL